MDAAVADFKKQFKPSVAPAVNEAPAKALEGEGAEAITKHVPPVKASAKA